MKKPENGTQFMPDDGWFSTHCDVCAKNGPVPKDCSILRWLLQDGPQEEIRYIYDEPTCTEFQALPDASKPDERQMSMEV